jgi:hypothetical protein
MERLFSPCTRYRPIVQSQGRVGPDLLVVQELNLDVSTEELLSAERAFTYADLYAMLRSLKGVVWLTSHAAVFPAVIPTNYGMTELLPWYLRREI